MHWAKRSQTVHTATKKENMKTFLILFGVFAISPMVEASSNPLNPSQDKPMRVYVETYTENVKIKDELKTSSGSEWSDDVLTENYNTSWSDSSGGSDHGTSQDNYTSNTYSETNDDWWAIDWPAGSDVGYRTDAGGDYDTVPLPVIWEHCNLGVPLLDTSGTWTDEYGVLWTEIYKESSHAQATIKLQTGGKATSRRQNLFKLSASATQIVPIKYNPPNINPQLPIPSQSITVMGESLDTNGNLYVVIPDNDEEDVTPQVNGADFYTFSVSATKYKSYFEPFVCQPWPQYPNDWWNAATPGYPYFRLGVNAGHAWWKLWTDAPTDAVSKMTLNSVNLEYLGVEVGYGPTNGISLYNRTTKSFVTAPGVFPWPNTDTATTNITYAIEFWDLISGLNYAEGIHNSPGTYSVANPENDCVSKTRGCGSAVGITLPNDRPPETFGFDLPPSNQ
jgi:hypothetical protein